MKTCVSLQATIIAITKYKTSLEKEQIQLDKWQIWNNEDKHVFGE